MLDINLIRNDPKSVKNNLKKRNDQRKINTVDMILDLDKNWRKLKYEADNLRAKRNKISIEINELIKQKKDATKKIKEVKKLPKKIKDFEEKADTFQQKIHSYLKKLPNILNKTVPIGKNDRNNKVIKKWGKIPKFNFQIKNHVELVENIMDVDFEASAIGARNAAGDQQD